MTIQSYLRSLGSQALAATAGLCLLAGSAQAAPEVPDLSPKARLEQRVGVTDFAIDYSSPAVKGRDIWGGLVPYGEVWRAGANGATRFTASKDFRFGEATAAAGTYALFVLPEQGKWTVILSKQKEAWGSTFYQADQDAARVEVQPEALPEHRERLAWTITDMADDQAQLVLEWEKVRVRVPLAVDTSAHVAANIQQAVNEAWRPHFVSARWLLDNDGDLKQALVYVDASIGVQATWWNHWVKAQILGKMGKKKDAVKVAGQAQALGKGDRIYEGFFVETVAKAIQEWKK